MKIRIIKSNPRIADEEDITHLIGMEFLVTWEYDTMFEIEYGESGYYLIHADECEVIQDPGSTESAQ